MSSVSMSGEERPERVFHLEAGACAAAYRHVLVVSYAKAPSVELLRRRPGWFHELNEAYGQGIAVITILRGEETSLPNDESRRETQRQMTDFGPRVHFIATVIAMPGVSGMAVRSMLRSIALLARNKFPFRFFATPAEAADFGAAQLVERDQAMNVAEHRRQLEMVMAWLAREQDRLLARSAPGDGV